MTTFNVDLNPKKSGMDLGEMLKLDEARAKNKLYKDSAAAKSQSKTATPAADAILAKTDMLKSDSADMGVPFKFGNNYQSEE